ncbi:MAG TPA: KH domain-containing protein [Patescibacteria group bacterium]|nr:KH domain-containing protein [Patescibacteria group bacterium]
MKDTLLTFIHVLVDHPDEVTIDERTDGDAAILTIHTNPSDIGKVIGKSGRIIRALRDLMKVLAAKRNTYVDVEIAEETA